jgi:hypothetical protein
MTSSATHGSEDPAFGRPTPGVEADSPAWICPRARCTVYILPDRRAGGWRGFRRDADGLEEIVVADDRAAELAADEYARHATVFDTPAWVEAV